MMTVELKDDLGQVWTPEYIVELMLDDIGYTIHNESILTQKIIEPSSGAGVFLYEIIRRLVTLAQKKGLSQAEIETLIDENIYSIEYDEEVYTHTLLNLKTWMTEEYSLYPQLPHFYNMDALDYVGRDFDYVVGNPPYISIHDMPLDMRNKVKTYSHSTGTTDLYIIFFEVGLSLLGDQGELAYITPNSWLRNVSQRAFRKSLIDEKRLRKVINFNADKVFDNVGAYTCISYLRKRPVETLTYVDSTKTLDTNYSREIKYENINLTKYDSLAFPSEEEEKLLSRCLFKGGDSLSDLCKVQNRLATLGDKFFLLDDSDLGVEDYVYPAIKGSKYKGEEITKSIIFPYRKVEGSFKGISEQELSESPWVYAHLLNNKELLSKRSLDKGSDWFWYGRSQSLQETDKEKIVFSHVISPTQTKIQAYLIPANTLVYSGLFITAKDNSSLSTIRKIIESADFLQYCRIVGKDLGGSYKTVSSAMVKKFKP